ncbi:MAG TPA: putative nucleotidyltransferase substrate binding domain-containing protein [Accumulibacter sp.]|jgi:CBS domain-containing protein|uniref:putative nucleotidyltransferase substrate binding domain-containing protein n=1 Tax=Accumulibacter sp. TaxID=2053492 RepID=UPI002C58CCD4|nr:putative nucleotidyltransferase substrate binding domain-containing protein [Accumulibacter sp.]HOG02673.1 putative nucleotidyltransferase substrate binding domain-containing protein [Accumulibacter sp.]HPU79199.1 putative nucleotidyltransferase substrate binding domain-containing protein [Accumulibacter sp.]
MNNSATEMLVAACIEFLQAYPPFDRMEAEALRFLAEHVRLAHYPKGALILSSEMGVAPVLYILQRGKVRVRASGGAGNVEFSAITLGPGQAFAIGALMAQRPTSSAYVAREDVFCYELPADDFFTLTQQSTVFSLFCSQYIAGLLKQSQQQLQLQFAQRAAEQKTMNSPLAVIVKREPVSVPADASIRQVVELMADRHLGSMVIVDAGEQPVGIFTLSDVLKRIVLPGRSLDQPISSVMSTSPQTLPLAANAHDAALAMAMHGIRHVLAVDEGGRLKGVVSERDLFKLQGAGLRQIRHAIDAATSLDVLQHAREDVRQLSLTMLTEGGGAQEITQFISTLNDTVTRRVIELNLDRHDLYGIDWAWLSFGSEGRDEQTFTTDQDNGIVFICTDIMDRELTQLRFLEFARDVNADLDTCGFPLCKGNIMASNPALCLTLEEWEEKFAHWVRTPEPLALLNATIFFDFRPLYGRFNLAHRMRLSLLRQTRGNPLFLRMLAQNALSVSPPLGRIRDFVTGADPEHPGTIDLKKYGVRLFTDAARVFALAHQIEATNTVSRLKRASTLVNFSSDDLAASLEGFNFIQLLRLRHQHFEQEHGRPGDNLIRPDELNEIERRILKEAFRQARKLQARLKLDYQL